MHGKSPEQMRSKAGEILAAVEHVGDPQSREILTRMAASYVRMARQMEDMASPGAGRWDIGLQPARQQQSQWQSKG
jgi:hypothetical protein